MFRCDDSQADRRKAVSQDRLTPAVKGEVKPLRLWAPLGVGHAGCRANQHADPVRIPVVPLTWAPRITGTIGRLDRPRLLLARGAPLQQASSPRRKPGSNFRWSPQHTRNLDSGLRRNDGSDGNLTNGRTMQPARHPGGRRGPVTVTLLLPIFGPQVPSVIFGAMHPQPRADSSTPSQLETCRRSLPQGLTQLFYGEFHHCTNPNILFLFEHGLVIGL